MKLTGLGTLGYALINIYLWPPKVAAIVNRTIDDQLGDPVTGLRPIYSPAEIWNNQLTCDPKCAIRPKSAYAFDGTYTAATYRPTTGSVPMGISMQFSGSAIYVFFILANNQTKGIINLTSANFTIDDNTPVLFTHMPDPSTTELQYQALVFAQTNLSNTLHALNITVMGSVNVYVNFDYAIYTHDDIVSATSSSTSRKSSTSNALPHSTAATSSKTPVGAIAGGTAGGILIFVFVIFLLFCWHLRRHGAFQRVRESEGPVPLITAFHIVASPSPGMSYAQTPVRSESEALAVTPQFANQTGYNSGHSARGGSAGPSRRNKLASAWNRSNATTSGGIPRSSHEDHHVSHPNTQGPTREEICCERQEELDNRLRVVHQEMEQATAGPGGSLVSRRPQTLEDTPGGADLSVSDMRAEVLLMREQIRVLREQQMPEWVQGLSDDPPPGYYTPMETRTQNSREVSS